MIVTVPSLTPVTSPVLDTVARLVLLDVHTTVRPVSSRFCASNARAMSCTRRLEEEPELSIVAVPGVTSTRETVGAGAVTVRLADPLLPSLVAVIVAVPALTAVTTPLPVTVATFVFDDDQVTVRPASVAPPASLVTADACVAAPTATVDDASDTLTDATGAGGGTVTVMGAVPLTPSLVAVIVALPAATPVTVPVDETVATFVFELAHVTTRPVSVAPDALRVTAVPAVVPPT